MVDFGEMGRFCKGLEEYGKDGKIMERMGIFQESQKIVGRMERLLKEWEDLGMGGKIMERI